MDKNITQNMSLLWKSKQQFKYFSPEVWAQSNISFRSSSKHQTDFYELLIIRGVSLSVSFYGNNLQKKDTYAK